MITDEPPLDSSGRVRPVPVCRRCNGTGRADKPFYVRVSDDVRQWLRRRFGAR